MFFFVFDYKMTTFFTRSSREKFSSSIWVR